MADVRGAIVIGRAARAAVLRVGGVGEAFARHGRVVDPEADRVAMPPRDVGEERIVGVHERRGSRVQAGDRGSPAIGDDLELAVAVELVAEEVAKADGLRPHTGGHVREGALIHLEKPQLCVLGSE
jgi:hypothetical protein